MDRDKRITICQSLYPLEENEARSGSLHVCAQKLSQNAKVPFWLLVEGHMTALCELNPLRVRDFLEERTDTLVLRLVLDPVRDECWHRDGV